METLSDIIEQAIRWAAKQATVHGDQSERVEEAVQTARLRVAQYWPQPPTGTVRTRENMKVPNKDGWQYEYTVEGEFPTNGSDEDRERHMDILRKYHDDLERSGAKRRELCNHRDGYGKGD